MPGRDNGFFVDGDAKGMAELTMQDGRSLILAAQNSGKMKVFNAGRLTGEIIRLNKDDVSAELQYETGETELREFYYGSGYLSSSSRVCHIPENVVSVNITTYSGESRTITFNE